MIRGGSPFAALLNVREVIEGFLGSIHGYTAPSFSAEDLASYEGDRLTR